MRNSLLWGLLILLLQVQAWAADAPNAPDAPVMEIDSITVTAQNVAEALAGMPTEEVQTLTTDPAKARELVRNLFRQRKVDHEAQMAVLENDPKVAWQLKQARQAVLERTLLAQFVAQQELPNFEELAHELYLAKPKNYFIPRRIQFAQIFVRIKNGDEESARTEAEELLARVQAGESFSELAKQYSDGPHGHRGGLFPDWMSRNVVPDNPVVAAVFALTEVGQVTDVLKSQGGFHILRLEGVQEAKQQPFEQVKGKIIEQLATEYERKLERTFQANLAPPAEAPINTTLLQQLIEETATTTPPAAE